MTLAYLPDTGSDELAALNRIATRYQADLVPLDELERAASPHGTPLPDTLGPAASSSDRYELSNLEPWIPIAVRERIRRIEQANTRLEARLQRAPTDHEMAKELAVTTEAFQRTLHHISRAAIAALDEYRKAKEAADLKWLHAQGSTGDLA